MGFNFYLLYLSWSGIQDNVILRANFRLVVILIFLPILLYLPSLSPSMTWWRLLSLLCLQFLVPLHRAYIYLYFPPTFDSSFLPTYFLPSSVPSFLLSFLPSFLPCFLPSYLPSFLPTYLPTILPTFLASFLPSFLPCFLPCFLPSFLPSFLPYFIFVYCSYSFSPFWPPSPHCSPSSPLSLYPLPLPLRRSACIYLYIHIYLSSLGWRDCSLTWLSTGCRLHKSISFWR